MGKKEGELNMPLTPEALAALARAHDEDDGEDWVGVKAGPNGQVNKVVFKRLEAKKVVTGPLAPEAAPVQPVDPSPAP